MDNKLGVFSGNCLLGICGEITTLVDKYGTALKVGDLVRLIPKSELQYTQEYSVEDFQTYFPPHVVVHNHYTTYTSGKITQTESNNNWIFGYRNADLNEYEITIISLSSEITEGYSIQNFNFKMFDPSIIEVE